MMRVIRINWKEQLQRLESYMLNQGGIVIVTGGSTSAFNTFVKLIRETVKKDKPGNVCIQLNPDDASTHTQEDIIVKLEQKLRIERTSLSNLSVASNIVAPQGNVTVHGITIDYQPNPYDASVGKFNRLEYIIQTIEERAQTCRIVLILYNWHKMLDRTVRWFWSEVWSDGLHRLADKILILCAYEMEDGNYPHKDLMPPPDCIVSLPAQYNAAERNNAVLDLTDFFMGEINEDESSARTRADILLGAWLDQPSQVYNGLPAQILYLKSKQWK